MNVISKSTKNNFEMIWILIKAMTVSQKKKKRRVLRPIIECFQFNVEDEVGKNISYLKEKRIWQAIEELLD